MSDDIDRHIASLTPQEREEIAANLAQAEAEFDACEHDWQPATKDPQFYRECSKCGWSYFDVDEYLRAKGIE